MVSLHSSLFLLLGVQAITANGVCTPTVPPPNAATCGLSGDISTPFLFSLGVKLGNQYRDPAGCADACSANTACVSFLLTSNRCSLYSASQSALGFIAFAGSLGKGYDLSCFLCNSYDATATVTATASNGISDAPATSTRTVPSTTATVTVYQTTIVSTQISRTTPTEPLPTVTVYETTCSSSSPAPPEATTLRSCNADNCLRALRGKSSSAAAFCSQYTTSMNMPTPTYASQCSGDTARVSSACSCFNMASNMKRAAPATTSTTTTVTVPSSTSTRTDSTATVGISTSTVREPFTVTITVATSVVETRTAVTTTVYPASCTPA